MSSFVVRFLTAGIVMGILDAIWLTLIANRFYKARIGPLLLDRPNLVAAVVFYLIYVTGVVIFAVNPAVSAHSWVQALGYGALLGLFAYATYDLTNLATLKGFPLVVVIVDLAWGTFLTGVVCLLTYLVVNTPVG